MADTVIENLITKLSFDFDDEKLAKFDKHLENAVKGLTAIVAGATVAATAIFAFTKKIAESNDELMKFAQRTGVDIRALQELGYVAELNGGSIDSMNSSLENLSRISSEAARGVGAGVEAFGMLGISVTDSSGRLKEADVMLNDVSDAISRLNTQAERLEFAQKLGIGPDLLLTIQQGSEAIKRQRQRFKALSFVITESAGKAAADFVDNMLDVRTVISGVANLIGTKLIKQFNKMNGRFIKWFVTNKKLIKQNINLYFDKFLKVVTGVFNVVKRVVGVVMSLVNAMGGLKNTIIVVTGLLLTMNASALLMPILLVAAAVGLAFILEDIIKFAEGGDSAVGQLAKKFPVLDAALRTLLDLLAMAKEGWILIFTEGWTALTDLNDMIEELGISITNFFIRPLNYAIALINKIPGIDIGSIGEAGRITGQGRAPGSTLNNNSISSSTVNKPTVNISIHGGNIDQIKHTIKDVLNQEYSGAETNLGSQGES